MYPSYTDLTCFSFHHKRGQANEPHAGNYNGQDFISDITKVAISGLGSATVWASEELEVDISGGGSVRYKGNPVIDENVSGIGRIERLSE